VSSRRRSSENHSMRRSQSFNGASCAILIGLFPLYGQGPTLAGSGYTDTSIIQVAPGQITTLFVTGLKTVLPTSRVDANVIPLPTTLQGISVRLDQTTPLPLLSLYQTSVCNLSPPPPPPPTISPSL